MKTSPDLSAALDAHPEAGDAYRKLPPSHRREHLDWIDEAKRLKSRRRRIDKAIGMLLIDTDMPHGYGHPIQWQPAWEGHYQWILPENGL